MRLTIAYITMREDSKCSWFMDSLRKQVLASDEIHVLKVDAFANGSTFITSGAYPLLSIGVVPPKPNVWQGSSRITKEDWFAAASARNTALCLAEDGWIAYVDDLSVLCPDWLMAVREAMIGNYMVFGTYQKVMNLSVDMGNIQCYDDIPSGRDSRLPFTTQDVSPCTGGYLYGCSLAGPVEAFLSVNGWPEDLCDGLGSEDSCMGVALQNAGVPMKFDRRMKTLESEELHHVGKRYRKEDWHFENGVAVVGGNGHQDKSHRALQIATESKFFPNSFGPGGIRELRQRILAGEPFPIQQNPQHDWYTRIALKDL